MSGEDFTSRARQARRVLVVALAASLVGLSASALGARTIDISIREGKVAGKNVVRVPKGETVTLRWISDKPLALHLHGYDKEVTVTPGKPAEMTFEARATGRFPVEIHGDGGSGGHQHKPLFFLEVHPQ